MAQNYSSNCFSTANVIETDMQNVENNFECLRSLFSGSSAPSNPPAGQLWYDTGSSVVKIRYNSSWISWFNCSTQGVVINTGAITSAHIAAGAVDAARLASGAALGNIGSSGITGGYIGGGQIAQVHLKTTYGEVSGDGNRTLPGGTYGFYPQVKAASGFSVDAFIASGATNASFVTNIYIYGASVGDGALQRYITSSGEVYWIFILRDRQNGTLLGVWSAPDHPCFGNGSDPVAVAHPFPDYNPEKHEILLFNPTDEEVEEMQDWCHDTDGPTRSMIDAFLELYDISDLRDAAWPTKAVTVGLPRKTRSGKRMGKVPVKKVIPRCPHVRPVRPRRRREG